MWLDPTLILSSILNFLGDETFVNFFIICNVIAIITWVLTIITDNYSQVDRIWSILPVFYAWGFLYASFPAKWTLTSITKSIMRNDASSPLRLIVMCLLITAWGVRLTYAAWRRGYFRWDHEDYRWVHVKAQFNYPAEKIRFHLLNFFFIAFIQNWLLLGLVSPLWYIQKNATDGFNWLDAILTALFLVFFAIEWIADEQQYSFQQKKRQTITSSRVELSNVDKVELLDIKRGFITRGLFQYSRHPSYFGEMLMWWTIFAFTLSAQLTKQLTDFQLMSLVNYTIFAALLLTWIFKMSSDLAEKISSEKYPQYVEYTRTVSKIVPIPFGARFEGNGSRKEE